MLIKHVSYNLIYLLQESKDEFNISHCTVPAFGVDSGESAVLNIHKTTAIETLLTHLGLDQKIQSQWKMQ